MNRLTLYSLCCALALSQPLQTQAQHEIYPQHFDLSEVTITSGPLKDAQDLNFKTLLAYDVDRLLTPFVRQAGLNTGDYAGWTQRHPNFDNWALAPSGSTDTWAATISRPWRWPMQPAMKARRRRC